MFEIEEIDGEEGQFLGTLNGVLEEAATALGKPFGGRELHLRVADEQGAFLGGLSGYALQGWFFVKALALLPDARGQGAGRALMARAEAIARARGLSGVWLDTYDFQAPAFYEKLGYSEFGRLPAVGGHPQRIWLAKVFDSDAA